MFEASRRRGRRPQPGAGSQRESGQALLELALIVPVLILIIMAVFQFAYQLDGCRAEVD